jgi:hypothetical protein
VEGVLISPLNVLEQSGSEIWSFGKAAVSSTARGPKALVSEPHRKALADYDVLET